MCVKETMMVVAAAFVVVHVQKRRLEKGKHKGQVHQDSSGKPHTHIVQSRQSRTPSLRSPFKEPYIPQQVHCTSPLRLTCWQGGAPELPECKPYVTVVCYECNTQRRDCSLAVAGLQFALGESKSASGNLEEVAEIRDLPAAQFRVCLAGFPIES